MWRPIILGLLTGLFLLVFIWSSAGIPHNYAMRSKVDQGLTKHGAGLEYNEWLVNLLITIGVAVISGGLSVLFGWRASRSARALKRIAREKRVRRGEAICIECGYDLRGQTEPRCPECGTRFDSSLLKTNAPNCQG